jgi:hypothetical protein
VLALTTLPNGDLLAGGHFGMAGGVVADRVARWNGAVWSPLGSGANGAVHAASMMRSGDLAVGGEFTTAGGLVSAYFARLATTCLAAASTSGAGCPSSGGANTLVANTLPWVDATWHTTGSGLPQTAIVATTISFSSIPQGAAPLSALLPQGVPGCDLLVLPDILDALVTTNGTAQFEVFLPNTPPLLGLTFYHQMIPFEIDALGNWGPITATNALQLTVGSF